MVIRKWLEVQVCFETLKAVTGFVSVFGQCHGRGHFTFQPVEAHGLSGQHGGSRG